MSLGPGRLTFAEFLAYEAAQEAKHELVDGFVADFSGGGLRHAAIVTNLITAIRPQLQAPHVVVGCDVIVATARGARHADVVVASLEGEDTGRTVRSPLALIEVISDLTAIVDLTEKVPEYTAIPELRELLLVDSRKRWAQAVRRDGYGWQFAVPQIAGAIHLASLEISLPLEAIYAQTGV